MLQDKCVKQCTTACAYIPLIHFNADITVKPSHVTFYVSETEITSKGQPAPKIKTENVTGCYE